MTHDTSRGCANSYLTTFAPELWPSLAEKWFQQYVKHFWQEKVYGVGFGEFGRGQISTTGNLDSGPIIDGVWCDRDGVRVECMLSKWSL